MNIELLRQLCLSMPGATEDIKYGTDLCSSIGGKIFCGIRIEGPFRTGLKCSENDFAELTERAGIVPMPRLSATGWIRIEKSAALNKKEWEQSVKKSYELVVLSLPKRKKSALGLP